jgi:hypothetical protein
VTDEQQPITFAVNEKGTIGYAPVAPPADGPRAPRPLRDSGREKQDAMRRPQAAVLYRALKAAGSEGLSWKECWALSTDEEFVVGPIVIWMRFHGCEVVARYDPVGGETRFYLV